jgi:hypothetical protein
MVGPLADAKVEKQMRRAHARRFLCLGILVAGFDSVSFRDRLGHAAIFIWFSYVETIVSQVLPEDCGD